MFEKKGDVCLVTPHESVKQSSGSSKGLNDLTSFSGTYTLLYTSFKPWHLSWKEELPQRLNYTWAGFSRNVMPYSDLCRHFVPGLPFIDDATKCISGNVSVGPNRTCLMTVSSEGTWRSRQMLMSHLLTRKKLMSEQRTQPTRVSMLNGCAYSTIIWLRG